MRLQMLKLSRKSVPKESLQLSNTKAEIKAEKEVTKAVKAAEKLAKKVAKEAKAAIAAEKARKEQSTYFFPRFLHPKTSTRPTRPR